MARQPQVTRTIVTTNAEILVVDKVQKVTKTIKVVLPRSFKDKKSALKMAIKLYDNEETKVVDVESLEEDTQIYGMEESKFVELADKLDGNRKKIVTKE